MNIIRDQQAEHIDKTTHQLDLGSPQCHHQKSLCVGVQTALHANILIACFAIASISPNLDLKIFVGLYFSRTVFPPSCCKADHF